MTTVAPDSRSAHLLLGRAVALYRDQRSHIVLRPLRRHASALDPLQLRLSAVARAHLRLSRHAGGHGGSVRHGALARLSRLGATAIGLSRLLLPPRRVLARRVVATSLPAGGS